MKVPAVVTLATCSQKSEYLTLFCELYVTMPWRCVAASVATPVVTSCHTLLGQLVDDGQHTCAAPLCVTNRFWIVKSKFWAALVLPNESTANTDTVMELLNTVVDGHDCVHAGVVTVLGFLPLPVLEVLDAPVSTGMKRV